VEKLFGIGEIAERVGVKPYVIRYWEREFGITPRRDSRGRRIYTEDDLKKFMEIKRLREEGYSIKGAKQRLNNPDIYEFLRELLKDIDEIIELLERPVGA